MAENIIGQRLEGFIDYLDISQNEFAKGIGLSSGLISYITSGKSNFGVDKLVKIKEKYPDLNIEWLISGKGNMLKSVKETEKDMIDLLSKKGIEILALNNEQDKKESYLYLPFEELNSSELKCFNIDNDSLSPYLFIGDYVLAEQNKNWKYNLYNNQLCVICTKNNFIIGRIAQLESIHLEEKITLKTNTNQKSIAIEEITDFWNVKCKITFNVGYGLTQDKTLDLITTEKKNDASSFMAKLFNNNANKPIVFYFGVMTPEIKLSVLRDIKKISKTENLNTIKSKRLFSACADCLEIKQISNTSSDLPTTFFSVQKTDFVYTITMGKTLPKTTTNQIKQTASAKKNLDLLLNSIYKNSTISIEDEVLLGLMKTISKNKSELLYEFVDYNTDFDLFLIKIKI